MLRLPFPLLALAVSVAPGMADAAARIHCHTTYGGETRLHVARPVASPYGVGSEPIGSHFLFRVVFEGQPRELAAVKIYTYADLDHGPTLIHQSTHPLPLANRGAYGFTGLQRVYEPRRDSELEYWCETAQGGRK
ncbi:hypothetical protein [Zoogloea sp. 1C4]|uniref:hypothetical protein n=1 Tax=Zoogloea sp. 1C4 TaxID=2570190 RepID=UPI0012917323|nr:hypothetical protein [Zoogloea sp. 1C4]